MNGHKFVQRQFYQIILCAFCNEFLLNAVGYQCEDCRYTCHKKCYEKVVTKCISKSNIGVCRLHKFRLGVSLTSFLPRTTMLRRSTIVSHTASNQSPILEQTGVVTVAICSRLVARMHVAARNVTLPATQTAHTWFPIFAVCPWKQLISSCGTGERSTRIAVEDLPLPSEHPSHLSTISIQAVLRLTRPS